MPLQGVDIAARFELPPGRVRGSGRPLFVALPFEEHFPEERCAQDRARGTRLKQDVAVGALERHGASLLRLGAESWASPVPTRPQDGQLLVTSGSSLAKLPRTVRSEIRRGCCREGVGVAPVSWTGRGFRP